MPVDINKLTEGWLELESDPGLFTLLLEDFGVKGVQVEEIYDLQKPLEGPIYGFIFLFRWIEERRSRRKFFDENESFVRDENIVNSIFFAQQMVPNSCATHALLSVLLNCPDIHLGSTLSRLKVHTTGMSPENKGWAIGNTPELACAHNSHAMPQARRRRDKGVGVSTGRYMGEAFHFVSYVPIRGRLFELDGLKPYPIDHGMCGEKEDWTEKFRRVMTERLGMATGGEPYHDIRFNLMAVVPDKRIALTHKLKILKTNRQIVLEALQQLVKLTHPELTQRCSDLMDKKEGQEEGKPSATTTSTSELLPPPPPPKAASSLLQQQQQAAPYLPVLETHNYCKNPLVEASGEVEGSVPDLNVSTSSTETASEDDMTESTSSEAGKKKIGEGKDGSLPPSTQASSSSSLHLDYSLPLTIQTSPAPSSSSTDTSSEVGSAFNSPTQGWGWNSGQTSPLSTKDIKKFVVIRVAGEVGRPMEEKMDTASTSAEQENSAKCSPSGQKRSHAPEVVEVAEEASGAKRSCSVEEPLTPATTATTITSTTVTAAIQSKGSEQEGKEVVQEEDEQEKMKERKSDGMPGQLSTDAHWISKYPELFQPHNFAPKDLLALLKNLEMEIGTCELGVRDENDKRKKYKVDDSRRTHNYDEFVCTFLSMLAQQGKLADLVKQHLLLHKRPGQTLPVGRLAARTAPKPEPRNNTTRRKRGRPTKYRRRK